MVEVVLQKFTSKIVHVFLLVFNTIFFVVLIFLSFGFLDLFFFLFLLQIGFCDENFSSLHFCSIIHSLDLFFLCLFMISFPSLYHFPHSPDVFWLFLWIQLCLLFLLFDLLCFLRLFYLIINFIVEVNRGVYFFTHWINIRVFELKYYQSNYNNINIIFMKNDFILQY